MKEQRHPDYPDSICDIGEESFWKSLQPRGTRGDGALLKRAVELGRQGEKQDAYETLARYHAGSLAMEWKHLQEEGPPEAIHAPLQSAAGVVRHKIYFAPGSCRHYGATIDWNEPAAGSIIDSFWWYAPLVKAYVDKPTARYREALCDILNQYYAARNYRRFPQPHYHPVYTALAGSIKLYHVMPAYIALAARGALDARTTESFLKLMLGVVRALYRRETDFVLSNQTIINARAFGVFAAYFPEFQESPAFRKRALDRLVENMEKGFLRDGGFYERSFNYGGYSLNNVTHAVQAMERAAPLPPAMRKRFTAIIRRAGRYYARALGPDYLLPPYADGFCTSGEKFLAAARPFFPRGTPADLGQDRSRSYLFKDSGFAVLRNGDPDRGAHIFFAFGRCDLWHTHLDCLTFDFWHGGRPLLLEAGRFDTYSHPLSRSFRMPEMHNTLTVMGQVWDERQPELWRGEDVAWLSTPELDYVSAAHRAYRGNTPVVPQAQNCRLRRAIVFVKDPGYVLVYDTVENDSDGHVPVPAIEQHWHAPQPFRVLAPGSACTIARGELERVAVLTAPSPALRRTETSDDFLPKEVLTSSLFPRRHHLCFKSWGESTTAGPAGFATLIFPFRGKPPHLTIAKSPLIGGIACKAELITVATPAGTDVFALNPDRVPGIAHEGRRLRGAGTVWLRGNAPIALR